MAVDAEGRILAFAADALTGVGPYSAYPRTSAVETNQVINLIGGPYDFSAYRARARVAFQNKMVMSQYRAVGHPIACTVTEALIDRAAMELGLDPAEMRRRNLIKDDAYPLTSATGLKFEGLSHHRAFSKMLAMMDYDALRAEQTKLRASGVHRGIGLASFIEITNPSPAFYGIGGAPIAAQDGCAIRLDPEGGLTLQVSVGEQGQGTETVLAQIAASVFEVPLAKVRVVTGDTETTPAGGDNWASRAAGIAGEATLQAAKALRANIIGIAGALLQTPSDRLDIRDGKVIEAVNGVARFDLAEIARMVYFRTDTLPEGVKPELMVTRHYVPRAYPFAFTNGVQASHVEIDIGTGRITLLKHWVVEDCGTVINPLLVAEQLRGGIVQGIGGALYEECFYDKHGQMRNANMADYLVPMAAEMPDIEIGHVRGTPTAESELGVKGTGEAGVAGAPAAVLNAVNDALKPFAARVTSQPMTPERILLALGRLP
jgi:carbon-monoxide dehydrogenase large subunit